MGLQPFEEYIVREKLELSSATMYLCYFVTVWKGSVLLACFNNISSSIEYVNCAVFIEEDEFGLLENIILNYIEEMKENGIFI
jgi:hypothetical protein